ncbi:MAG: 50S ribosomal protein L25 [Candidatus Gottesmanbacteria bacterium]
MSSHKLQADVRTITGKKVKTLRSGGQLPATVYGKGIVPQTISVAIPEFSTVYREAGETGLIELIIGEKKHSVLIHTVQVDPVRNNFVHVEFHEVNLKEKVHADVPVELTGEASAVKEKLGVLLPLMDHIEVEALPAELPEKIVVDISGLAVVNDQIIVGELTVPSSVTVLTDPTRIVVKIGAFVVIKEPEPVVAETSAEEIALSETTTEGGAESTDKEEKTVSEEK